MPPIACPCLTSGQAGSVPAAKLPSSRIPHRDPSCEAAVPGSAYRVSTIPYLYMAPFPGACPSAALLTTVSACGPACPLRISCFPGPAVFPFFAAAFPGPLPARSGPESPPSSMPAFLSCPAGCGLSPPCTMRLSGPYSAFPAPFMYALSDALPGAALSSSYTVSPSRVCAVPLFSCSR